MELDVETDDVSDGNPNPGLAASDISEEGLEQLATLLRRFRKVNRQIQHAKAKQTAAGRGGSTKKSRHKITLLEDEQKRISDEISVLKGNAPREPLAPAPTKEDLIQAAITAADRHVPAHVRSLAQAGQNQSPMDAAVATEFATWAAAEDVAAHSDEGDCCCAAGGGGGGDRKSKTRKLLCCTSRRRGRGRTSGKSWS
jgi:hypothetical protein